jgi:hypothetical protein
MMSHNGRPEVGEDGASAAEPRAPQTLLQRAAQLTRRFLPPSGLLLALLLFPLPWIDFQCERNTQNRATRPTLVSGTPPAVQRAWQWLVDHFGPGQQGWQTMLSQSGLETALGKYSGNAHKISDRFAEGFDARLVSSPLMVLLPMVLLLGAFAGFLIRPGVAQRILVAACALSALGLLLGQIILGFPLEQTILEMLQSETARRSSPQSSAAFHFKYTFWFGLALCAVFASAIASGAQVCARIKVRYGNAHDCAFDSVETSRSK